MKRLLAALAFCLWGAPALANVPCTLPFTLTNGTTADASQVMANYNAIVTCLGSAAAAGSNSDITSLSGLTTPISPAEGGTFIFLGATSTGAANAQVVASTTPTSFTLTKNYSVVFQAGFTNTGATTFAINGTAATNVFRMTPSGQQALTGGEIVSGDMVVAIFDGTEYQLLSTHAQFGGLGPLTSIASAATTDLGTAPSHNISITGTTTITAFGSTANATYPNYHVCFTGVLTLTFNATSLILPTSNNITTAAKDCAFLNYLGGGNWQVVDYQTFSGATLVPTTAPNIQVFTSGTAATYTTPTNALSQLPLYLRVREVGGAGGGAAVTTNAGSNGGDTSFASWTAIHGAGGGVASNGGAGGSGGVNGTGTQITRVSGAQGDAGNASGGGSPAGGIGGSSPFGGAGAGTINAAGGAASANSGSGGGGASTSSGSSSGGGGAGEYVEFIITSPVASYTYTVGAAGAGGAAGGAAGGNGGAGRIEVMAFWQ